MNYCTVCPYYGNKLLKAGDGNNKGYQIIIKIKN